MENKWISVKEEVPEYYKPILCDGECDMYSENNVFTCWRANDGEKDIYTISGTDTIMKSVSRWMPSPSPYKEVKEINIVDIQEMPNYNADVPNGKDSVSKGLVFSKGGYPNCIRHGAMLKISNFGIWRCGELGCDNGCYQLK